MVYIDKRKLGSNKHEDIKNHDNDSRVGRSQSDKKKSSTGLKADSLRWCCSNCAASNLSSAFDLSCPFCDQPRSPGNSTQNGAGRPHTALHTDPRVAYGDVDTGYSTSANWIGPKPLDTSIPTKSAVVGKKGALPASDRVCNDGQFITPFAGPLPHPNINILIEARSDAALYHLHPGMYPIDVQADIAQFIQSLPEELRYDLQMENVLGQTCWTCIPPDTLTSYPIPLTIANSPVVVPIQTSYPLNPGLTPPPDPHPHYISPVKEIERDTAKEILDTFKEATGFYLLINGMLQLIVPDHFDVSSALNSNPGRFGGLKVSYVFQSQIPTAGRAHDPMIGSSTNPGSFTGAHSTPTNSVSSVVVPSASRASKEGGLVIGGSVRALVDKSKSKNRHQAKLGLMTISQERTYLTLSTHLITQALADSNLKWKWPQSGFEDVKLVAGNHSIKLGAMTKTFDVDANSFPDGFEHDVSLVDITEFPVAMTAGMSPDLPLDWLSEQEWKNLQYATKEVFLLDDKDRNAKSIGLEPNLTQMVGQGIFANHQKSKRRVGREVLMRGKQKENAPSEMDACTDLITRSILYRVAQDYEAPGGQSGTPVCVLDKSDPGVQSGKVVGFTSYVQMVQDIQHYHMEGEQLAQRLRLGRIAFYGAFKVPQEMRDEHIII